MDVILYTSIISIRNSPIVVSTELEDWKGDQKVV